MHGLTDLRVVDFSTGIAGAYCAKLLTDAGADVVKVEPKDGDPLRRWTASGRDVGLDGALFRFLHHGQRSVVGALGDPEIDDLIADADVLIESGTPGTMPIADLRAHHPALVILSITPYGQHGPMADRPLSDLVIQAECGALAIRGRPDAPPIQAGGRVSEWVSGTFAAVAVLGAQRGALTSGIGEHIDFSIAELMNVAGSNYADLGYSLFGRPPFTKPGRTLETPSIEPTLDGYVGVNTNTNQQFQDFCLLIERPDLLIEGDWAMIGTRQARFDEWQEIVHAWTTRHTTAEAVEAASLLRIPVAPVCHGGTVQDHDHFDERGVYLDDPTGTFRMPRRPWMMDFERPGPMAPAPALGEHTGRIERRLRPAPVNPDPDATTLGPLAGLRVLDLTAWWAGPSSCNMLASMGADVVHVEAIQRLDGMRMSGGMFRGQQPQWWEWSGFFLQVNSNKLGLTLDLTSPRGKEIVLQLCEQADLVIENFTPRVLDNFGLTWDLLHDLNPRLSLIRMPAFGLDGPWRDRTGFAQTMEQLSGLAWVTGHVEDQPRIQRGPSDPNAGMHAAFAALVALTERDHDGLGHHIEATMIEGALNAAVEQVIEFTAYDNRLDRDGNRSPWAAPQNLYPAPGVEQWVALAAENDEQWLALCAVVGRTDWAADPGLAGLQGRRARHDELDEFLARWVLSQPAEGSADALVAAGVPAGVMWDARETYRHPQFRARRFYEEVDHPVVGRHPVPTLPFRFASRDESGRPWIRRPAPTLGQHNHEVLTTWIGMSAEDIAQLEADEVIGTWPKGV